MSNIKFADYWIRTADLWYRKQLLYQLRYNHNNAVGQAAVNNKKIVYFACNPQLQSQQICS